MPIFRYFVLVGGCLVALLFVVNRYLPEPAGRSSLADIDRSTIRIRSARIGPEKLEFDTSRPPQAIPAAIEAAQVEERPRAAFAMMPESKPQQAAVASAVVARAGRRKRVAHTRSKALRPTDRQIALDHTQPFVLGW